MTLRSHLRLVLPNDFLWVLYANDLSVSRENGVSMFLRNVGVNLQVRTDLQKRIPTTQHCFVLERISTPRQLQMDMCGLLLKEK
jgi:hypothetical protein